MFSAKLGAEIVLRLYLTQLFLSRAINSSGTFFGENPDNRNGIFRKSPSHVCIALACVVHAISHFHARVSTNLVTTPTDVLFTFISVSA